MTQATDRESASRINMDGVHILINLNGFTNPTS
jgi:predicted O-linked N-acetylglucosamine transferase (SPINDLY family)